MFVYVGASLLLVIVDVFCELPMAMTYVRDQGRSIIILQYV